MKIKRFVVPSMQVGLKQVGESLGPGAVILSNRRLAEGLEIVAGVDEAELAAYQAKQPARQDPNAIIKAKPDAAKNPGLDQSSLQSLLEAMAPKNRAAFEPQNRVTAAPDEPEAASPALTRPARVEAPVSPSRSEVPQTNRPVVTASDEVMKAMREEIAGLRTLLEQQTDLLREPAMPKLSPSIERLEARLDAMGISQPVKRSLVRHYDSESPLETNWRRLMGRLSAGLATPLLDPIQAGGAVALCGPTGAGKSTTLAKMAARYVRDHGARGLTIVSADYFQMGAQTALASVARILGVDYIAVRDGQPLSEVLAELSHKQLVLIDTSGSREALQQWRLDVVDSGLEQRLSTVMVLPATAHETSIQQFLARFPGKVIRGAVLTKLDEAPCFGSLFDSLLRYRWPVWYCSAGQNIPRDLEPCDPAALVKRLMKSLKSAAPAMAKAG
ncbi:MAG: flagellar biosynthesis protein FlhF [Saccharospirillum sp.]